MVAELAVGEEFAGHRIEALLGRGGMGVVYLAEHLRLGRKVAIKLVNPELASDDAFRRRFLRESQAAAALEHPNIVPIYDAGESEGLAYISMRHVDGLDLSALLKSEGSLSPDTAIAIAYQVAMALDAAHEHGLIHRDVKPANVLLERFRDGGHQPRAFLSDFGITKRLSGEQTTETGRFIGTIDYTAPEQITGVRLDPATDQYSLACVLFQSLTGTVPFPRGSDLAVMYAHLEEAPPPVSGRIELSPRVDAVISRGMAKSPAQRFGSCSELVTSVADALGIQPRSAVSAPRPTAKPSVAPSPSFGRTVESPDHVRRGGGSRHARRGRVGGLVATTVAVLVITGVAGAIIANNDQGSPASAPPSAPAARPSTTPSSGAPATSPAPPKPFPQSFSWRRVSSSVFDGPGRQAINRAVAARSSIYAVGYEDPPGIDDGDPVVWRSSDGVHWARTTKTEPGTEGMDAVAAHGKDLVAVGSQDQQRARVWIIPADGSPWDTIEKTGISGGSAIHKVIPTSVGLVAVGWASGSIDSDASVWRSADGREWTLDTADAFAGPAGSDQEMWGVTAFSGGLVAAGSDDRGGDPDAAFWLHDQDGWSEPVLLRKDGDQVVKAVVAGGGGLVAVGSTVSAGSQDAAIWISADGSKWHAVPGLAAPGSQQLTGVVAYGSGFVAVGSEGATKQLDMAVWTSRDGRTWKRSTSEEFGGPGTQFAHGALAFKGKLVVVGNEDLGGTGQAAVWIGTPVSSSATPGPSTGHTGSPADESPTP